MIKKHDKHFMDIAFLVASASKCRRAQFGSVIVSADGRIVATGRNGKPRGSINDDICYREGLPPNSPKINCCTHSEANSILFSSPLERQGGTMYVSGKPCADCQLLIAQSGVVRLVFWAGENDHGHPGWVGEDIWEKYGITIERTPFTNAEWEERFGDGKIPTSHSGSP